MADKPGKFGHMRPGRRSVADFHALVSPLGENAEETPRYSPSTTVNGAKGQTGGRASGSESARNERRGG
jgi:hypothetical protein